AKRPGVEEEHTKPRDSVELIGDNDVETSAVATGQDALAALQKHHFDCMVLDLVLPDMTGFELIEKIKKEFGRWELPIVVYTGKELTTTEQTELKRVAEAIVIKDAKSPERLLD